MKRRFIAPAIRPECVWLLNELDLEINYDLRAPGRLYFHLGRWLVRADVLDAALRSGICKARYFLRFRIVKLKCSDPRAEPELILVRQTRRPQVSAFRCMEMTKETIRLYKFDFERELAADREFRAIGMRCPPLISVDRSRRHYVQSLVSNPLMGLRVVGMDALTSTLADLMERSEVRWFTPERYFSEVESAILKIQKEVSSSFRSLALDTLEVIRKKTQRTLGEIPMLRCHGDFSVGNLLIGDDRVVYINDFDRSFLGTAYFDLMYFGVIERLSPDWFQQMLDGVSQWSPSARISPNVAAGFLILDLLRFVGQRFVEIDHPEDRLCLHSIELIEEASRFSVRSLV